MKKFKSQFLSTDLDQIKDLTTNLMIYLSTDLKEQVNSTSPYFEKYFDQDI